MLHEDLLPALLVVGLSPKAVDPDVDGPQEARDFVGASVIEHPLERELHIGAVVVEESRSDEPAGGVLHSV